MVEWSPEMEVAFGELCNPFCDHVKIAVPSSSDIFKLQADASMLRLGSISVMRPEESLPLGFHS